MKHLIFFLILIVNFSAWSQSTTLFDAANEAYASGDYQRAVSDYEKILEQGQTSAALHYNLANSYYKLDRIAPSIYHYEKALLLDPDDQDIQNNLAFARRMTIDAIGEEQGGGLRGLFEKSTGLFSPSGWAWIAVVSMLLFVVFFLVYFFSVRTRTKRMLFLCSMLCLVIAITTALVGITRQNLQQEHLYAIVFSEEVEVKSEPSVRSGEVFRLHEGAKVKVTENFQDWVEIQLPNGSQGWMRQTDLKTL